jgi:ABC-type multidrug transport system fused ATPase/permease subunit
LFWSWLKPERSLITIATIALFISTLCTLAIPQFFGKIIDDVASSDDTSNLNRYILILLFVFIIGAVFTLIRGGLYNLIGERLVARLRGRLYKHIVLQDISFFDENKTGELMNRLASDTTVIQSALSVNISMGLRSAAQVVFSVALLFVTSWKLTLVMMAVVPSLILSAKVYGQFTKRISKQYQDALAQAADAAQECIGNARTVKSFGGEGVEIQRYASKVSLAFAKGRTKSWAYGVFVGGIGLLANLAILLVLWYGGKLVISDEISTGDLTAFMLYTIYIALGLGTLAGLYTELMTSIGASTRIVGILHREPTVPTGFVESSKALDTDSIIYSGQDPDSVWDNSDEAILSTGAAEMDIHSNRTNAQELERLLGTWEANELADIAGDGTHDAVTSTQWIVPEKCNGEIAFKDVVFAYATRLDTPVLNGFSLHIPSNQRVALVGASGSGKVQGIFFS